MVPADVLGGGNDAGVDGGHAAARGRHEVATRGNAFAAAAGEGEDHSSFTSPAGILTPESSHSENPDIADKDGDGDGGGGGGIELQILDQTRRRSSSATASIASSASSSLSSSSLSSSSFSLSPRRHSGRSGGHWAYTAEEERAVVRKFDRRLVAFVAMLYMLSFLDRSNIGNARVAGMDADLQTDPPRADWYEWALTAFYVTYIAFEWLALLWRVLPAHAYVAALVAAWGLTAALQAVAPTYPWLVALRALLGIGEAGFAGIPLYLARFFKRDELALRTAVFIAAAPLATTFAASLAWVILAAGRHLASPVAAWRLLFLVEGFPSVLAAVAAWRVLPDAPGTASYLTRRERALARRRLAQEEEENDDGDDDDDDDGNGEKAEGGEANAAPAQSLLAVLADPVAWLTAAMFFLTNMAYSSLPVFLPTILAAMGHDAVASQALAAPPYLVACGLVLVTAYASDRLRARAPLLVTHALASAAGYGVLSIGDDDTTTSVPHLGRTSLLRYAAVYPAAAGFFNVVVLLIAWNLNNQRGAARQGGAFALFQVVGQCGPLVGTRLYPDGDAPLFLRGMRTMAGAMLGVAVLAVVLRAVLRRRNRQLDAAAAARRAKEADTDGENDDDDDDDEEYGVEGQGGSGSGRGEEEGLVGRSRRRGENRGRPHPLKRFRYML